NVQLAIAREYGFASWRKLKAHVESCASMVSANAPCDTVGASDAVVEPLDPAGSSTKQVNDFIEASISPLNDDHRSGKLDRAQQMLREHPELREVSIFTACVLGDAKRIAQLLKTDPKLATTAGGPRGWAPLLYHCFSRFMRLQTKRARD